MDNDDLDSYLQRMGKSGTFGDGIALSAAARCYNRNIVVISPEATSPLQRIDLPQSDDNISRQSAMYLGLFSEHYVSVNPKQKLVDDNNTGQAVSSCHEGMQVELQNVAQKADVGDLCVASNDALLSMSEPAVSSLQPIPTTAESPAPHNACNDLPTGVSAKSWEIWRKSRPWLGVKDCKVICTLCSYVGTHGGMGVLRSERLRTDDAFVVGVIAARKKLLKKIDKHSASRSHITYEKLKNLSAVNEIETAVQKARTVWDEANNEKILATCKVFNVAYTCAKEELSYMKHPALMELMEKNGMAQMTMLVSDHACSDITTHIADSMRSALVQHINSSEHPFSVMVDESTTLSGKTGLIIYVRIPVENEVCNLFFSLVELTSGATAENIADAIYQSLVANGVKPEVLQHRMIGFASDGASVMRGEHAGTAVRLKAMLNSDFKSFHCMAHRLELAVNGAVKSCGEIKRLQMLTDSLYAFYHRSPKNMYELSGVAESLQKELVKITQIFTVRWVFSTYRAVNAFVTDYSSLCKHLKQASDDTKRKAAERATCRGFAIKLTEWLFVAELLLLADTLEVLWNLSAFLQQRSASLTDVKHKLTVVLTTLTAMKNAAGLSLSKLLSCDESATTEVEYDGVTLSRTKNDSQVSSVCIVEEILRFWSSGYCTEQFN
jgi:hypothetical protein